MTAGGSQYGNGKEEIKRPHGRGGYFKMDTAYGPKAQKNLQPWKPAGQENDHLKVEHALLMQGLQ